MSISAPELQIQEWLNTSEDITLKQQKGKIVCLFAFQMLCPGCVQYLVPQIKKTYQLFSQDNVQVIGLHTVFEHHAAMTKVSLNAFINEYNLDMPIGIDLPHPKSTTKIPLTMESYNMRGTPTTILIDPSGDIVSHQFGHIDDMALGRSITRLIL